MLKRVLSFILILALVLGLAMPVLAVEQADSQALEAERLKQQCRTIYRKALYASGHSSLQGLCGLMTGLQIWKLGITRSAEVYNGNGFYDAYKQQDVTSGGYKVRCIDASAMSLEEALNQVSRGGTENVYNLIACFQWTNTRAGSVYGHAVVIHGIVDGNVYFVEGFPTSIGGAEGNPLVCSIAEFEDFYGDWTRYEGLVELGTKAYTDFCTTYPADLFLSAPGALILDAPQAEGGVVRQVQEAEVLRATEVCQNPDGGWYYRVNEGYIEASKCAVSRVNTEDVTAQAEIVSAEPGKSFAINAKVTAPNSAVSAVQMNVADMDGKILQTATFAASGHMSDLPDVQVSALEQGAYRVQLLAVVENNTVSGDKVSVEKKMVTVLDESFGVGQEAEEIVAADAPVLDGWVFLDGVRYFYDNGAPRVGWYCDGGADYYFKEDGSVTTGWAEINGRWRCFTDTGVMRTGWVETSQGRCYMLSNGVAALGEKEIDGIVYNFGENGILIG